MDQLPRVKAGSSSFARQSNLNRQIDYARKRNFEMIKKQKLELTWIGKDEQPVLEPRILIEDPSKSYGDPPMAENSRQHARLGRYARE